MRDGWVETTLAHVAEVNPRVGGVDSEAPFITMADVDEWGRWARTSGPRANRGGAKAIGGDVLVARITPCLENGKIAQVPHEWGPVGGSTEFLVVRAGAQVLPDYLYYWAQEPQTHLRSTRRMIGTSGRKRVSAGDYEQLPFLLPPIEEQRRIVDLMSHVDDALRSCDALVSAEGALLDAASEALVFSPEFPLMKVGDLAEGKRGLVGGPFGSSLVGRDYVETGVPVIRGQNLQGRYVSGDFVFVSEEKSRSLHGNQATPGDVVFTQRGTLGQVSLILDDAYPNYVVSQSQMRLTPDRSIVSADWVYHAFRTPRMVQRIKRADTSTANPHINLGILRAMDLPIPSVDMQAQVCSQLNAIEASIVAKMAESEALKSTRGALLSALLGGTHQIPSSYDEFIRDEGAA